MNSKDNRTLVMFEELSDWSSNIDNGYPSTIEKIREYYAGKIDKEELLAFCADDLRNASPEEKKIALKIFKEKRDKFASLVVNSALNNIKAGETKSFPLIALAWSIINDYNEEANFKLSNNDESNIVNNKINNYLTIQR